MMNDFLKTTFNGNAELYNEVRPRYPEELFDTLEEAAQLSSDAQLLEIGPGTGQATKPLAQRGYNIVAIELGDELANVASRELEEFNDVKVITGSFEEVELQPSSFDLVYCATAFHWIKPEVKFAKTHSLLKDGGYLAVIYTYYVSDKDNVGFFETAQRIFEKYDKYKIAIGDKKAILPTDEIKEVRMDSAFFEPVLFEVFPGVLNYSIDDYIKLLCTFSVVIAMDTDDREGFLEEIRELGNRKYNGMVTVPLSMSLKLGRKV